MSEENVGKFFCDAGPPRRLYSLFCEYLKANNGCFCVAAWPLADAALTQEILDLLQSATHIRQSKKGANEGTSLLVTLSALIFGKESRS